MIKKLVILYLFLLIGFSATAQNVFFTRTGHIYFISHTEAIDIDANNYQVASFLDIATGKIQCAVLIKSFEFNLATAKEHFNENYMESEKYPKATFKGEIVNMEDISLEKPGVYSIVVRGEIVIRGITKNIDVLAELTIKNNEIIARSEFVLEIADFKITVPKLVEQRVAKKIAVTVNMVYLPHKK